MLPSPASVMILNSPSPEKFVISKEKISITNHTGRINFVIRKMLITNPFSMEGFEFLSKYWDSQFESFFVYSCPALLEMLKIFYPSNLEKYFSSI